MAAARIETEINEAIARWEEAQGTYPEYIVLGPRRYEDLCNAVAPRLGRRLPRKYKGCFLIVVGQEMLDVTTAADMVRLS